MKNWGNEDLERTVVEGIFCQFCGAELVDEAPELTIENKPYEIWSGGNGNCAHQSNLNDF